MQATCCITIQPEEVARLIEEFLALMAQFFAVHPTHPQKRLIRQRRRHVRGGGLIAYPDRLVLRARLPPRRRTALERLRRIRGVDERHHLTLDVPRPLRQSRPTR